MRLGFQVSISGRLPEAVERAQKLHCQTMQIFTRNPRGWQIPKTDAEEIEEFKEKRKEAKIFPLFVHIPYLINLASPEEIVWRKSINFFAEDLNFGERIGADYLVTHLGSHKGKGEKFGEARFIEGLNRAIAKAKTEIKILLENTAGQGNSLGYNLIQIKRIREGIDKKELVGLCFDTAHAFSAGYRINTQEGLEKTGKELQSLDLWDKLILVHLNDSKADLGTHFDRHEHIGKGKIGREGFRLILNHPQWRDLIFIMETPRRSEGDDFRNLKRVLRLSA